MQTEADIDIGDCISSQLCSSLRPTESPKSPKSNSAFGHVKWQLVHISREKRPDARELSVFRSLMSLQSAALAAIFKAENPQVEPVSRARVPVIFRRRLTHPKAVPIDSTRLLNTCNYGWWRSKISIIRGS